MAHKEYGSAVILISSMFWDPSYPPRAHDVRAVHSNPSNWVLLPYIPDKYRNLMLRPWGTCYMKSLERQGLLSAYMEGSRCVVCGGR